MPVSSRMKRRRLKQGLCVFCGASRGKDGTPTMCRPCAIKKVGNNRLPKNHIRTESGEILLKCDNCFKTYPWRGSGQRIFCDACIPWFDDYQNEALKLREANRVQPDRNCPLSAQKIIDGWARN